MLNAERGMLKDNGGGRVILSEGEWVGVSEGPQNARTSVHQGLRILSFFAAGAQTCQTDERRNASAPATQNDARASWFAIPRWPPPAEHRRTLCAATSAGTRSLSTFQILHS